MKKKTIIEADYYEIENLVRQHYNNSKYSFPLAQECCNDTTHKFNVDGKLDESDLKDWENDGPYYQYNNYLVLNKLCADGHIESGKYIINVSW